MGGRLHLMHFVEFRMQTESKASSLGKILSLVTIPLLIFEASSIEGYFLLKLS